MNITSIVNELTNRISMNIEVITCKTGIQNNRAPVLHQKQIMRSQKCSLLETSDVEHRDQLVIRKNEGKRQCLSNLGEN